MVEFIFKLLLRISNIILSLLLVVITTGFTISKHFCHDRLVNTELFAIAQSCHEAPESCCAGAATTHCGNAIEKDDCCKNESDYVKFTELFTLKQKNHPLKQLSLFGFFSNFQKNILHSFESPVIKVALIQPPPLLRNVQAFIQSFII